MFSAGICGVGTTLPSYAIFSETLVLSEPDSSFVKHETLIPSLLHRTVATGLDT